MKNNPTLHKTFWFWVGILFPIALGVCVGFNIFVYSTDHLYTLSNIDKFVEIYKVPITISGLAIPFVAVIAAIHRSSQTAMQIEAQQTQNIFSNHFKHLEEFKKAFSDCNPAEILPWKSVEDLHRTIYPNSMIGDLNPAPSMYRTVTRIREYSAQYNIQKLFIIDDILVLSKEICIYIDIDEQIIRPSIMANLCEVIYKAINFSALNEQPATLSEVQHLTLISIDTLYSEICDAIKRTDESITPLLDEIYLTEEETLERTKNMSENDIKTIVLNALKFISEHSIESLQYTYQSLSNNARDKLTFIFDEHLSDYDNDGYHEVKKIYKLCKTFE